MYKSLSPAEKLYFLGHVEVKLIISEDLYRSKKASPFLVKLKKTAALDINVLKGKIFQYEDLIAVQQFQSTDFNLFRYYEGLYEIFCYEAIGKLMAFAKSQEQKNLRIYTTDGIIVNQLFSHKADLKSLDNTTAPEIMANIRI